MRYVSPIKRQKEYLDIRLSKVKKKNSLIRPVEFKAKTILRKKSNQVETDSYN